MPFLTHAGATLRYDRTGAGPAVLLIHGWLGNRTFWERQVAALRDRFTVITVDLRGHGESSPPRTGYSIGAMAADLEQLVRALAVPRLSIVGWSMGGMIAQELARRLGDRVHALVLVCTSPGGIADPKNPHANQELADSVRNGVAEDFRGFVRTFAPGLFKAGADSPLLAWAVAQLQKTPPHVAEACIESVLEVDLRPKLGAIGAPTLVVHGRHDALFPVAMAEEMTKAIPGAKLVVFEESGHSPGLEEPEAFNEVVGEFIAHPGIAPKVPVAKAAAPEKAAPAAKPAKAQVAASEKKLAAAEKAAKPQPKTASKAPPRGGAKSGRTAAKKSDRGKR